MVTLFFSLTHVTYVTLHHTVVIRHSTSISYGTLYRASGHLVIYSDCYGFKRVFFTPWRFLPCTPSCFSRIPWPWQLISKLTGLHADLRKIAPPHLIVWTTTIHKIFICGRFYLRVKAGWPRNIRLYGTLVLWNISFTETLFLKYSPLTGFELSSQQVKMLQASCHNR